MGLRSRRSALASIALCAAACNALPPEDFGARQGPITNGAPDQVPAHDAVVAISIGHGGMCTGTLIAPRVVLTAAHCIEDIPARYLAIGFGDDMSSRATKWVRASEALAHPQYDPRTVGYDIGLIRLSSAPPIAVEPIPPLPSELKLTSTDLGSSLVFTGFGVTETGDSGTKLQVTDGLDFICEDPAGCRFRGSYASPHTICYDQQPGGPCQGDSGGPAFVVREGREYVAGVTSYGDQACSYYGCSTKVDSFEQFIADFVRGSVGTTCTADADCSAGSCIDGVCCESDCTGGCGTCVEPGYLGTCRPLANGTACDDGNGCTRTDSCFAGACLGGDLERCEPNDPCRLSGVCDPRTGGCNWNTRADGTACDDQSLCTSGERCQGGLCTAAKRVKCERPTECRPANACDPETGECAGAPVKDGTKCKGGTCEGGECVSSCGGCSATGLDALPVWGVLAAVGAWRRRVKRSR